MCNLTIASYKYNT